MNWKTGAALLVAAGAALVPQASREQTTNTGPFRRLPEAVIEGLRRQSLGLATNPSLASPAVTNSSWGGSGNLGTIPQTNLYEYEYFPAPSSVPVTGVMTYLEWGYTVNDQTPYPLTIYLCVGSTSHCVNVSSSRSGGYFSTAGYGFSARTEVFFVAFASAASTVELQPEIIVGSNYAIVGYSY